MRSYISSILTCVMTIWGFIQVAVEIFFNISSIWSIQGRQLSIKGWFSMMFRALIQTKISESCLNSETIFFLLSRSKPGISVVVELFLSNSSPIST